MTSDAKGRDVSASTASQGTTGETGQEPGPRSRAAERAIQPGSWVRCSHCEEQVAFKADAENVQAICNVYEDGQWARVEHFHLECYNLAGEPYGPTEQ